MTRIILAASLAAIILLNTAAAQAGITCQTIDGITHCSDTDGKFITCQTIDGITYCN